MLPYRRTPEALEYAVLSRSDYSCWQGIAGGGEDDETPLEAAKREAFEEAGISSASSFMSLQASCTIPVIFFQDGSAWDPALYAIPQHSFGADCTGQTLMLSSEHDVMEWLPYTEAYARFTYMSNQTALWELNQRLSGRGPRGNAA